MLLLRKSIRKTIMKHNKIVNNIGLVIDKYDLEYGK